ncbi:hypothetical protein ACFO0N_17200 [Halobium salinum]|uniref:Uncharacterized protein n=1 Tax=Halobium salinum TaxID=1364940 RepID=A0ABD5PG39_9EURY|nr:hypothetical protein [Halobium salinum]
MKESSGESDSDAETEVDRAGGADESDGSHRTDGEGTVESVGRKEVVDPERYGAEQDPAPGPDYGEAWVYESIVGALPGADLAGPKAVALQLVLFQVAILLFGWLYELPNAVLAGTAAVVVAGVGSVAMLRIGRGTRSLSVSPTYRRLLFGSSIEVVLAVLAFIALVTHLFVFDPQQAAVTGEPTLMNQLFGPAPPTVPVFLMLLVLWDLCYRIGTSWWTAVVSLWGSVRIRVDDETSKELQRLDAVNVGFALAQLLLVPFLLDERVLLFAVGGHVVAVTVVSGLSTILARRGLFRNG